MGRTGSRSTTGLALQRPSSNTEPLLRLPLISRPLDGSDECPQALIDDRIAKHERRKEKIHKLIGHADLLVYERRVREVESDDVTPTTTSLRKFPGPRPLPWLGTVNK
jgi:hypothetical protein